MAIEISKLKPTDRASADTFNASFEEIQTFINNLQSENDALRQQLNNKVEKSNINGVSFCNNMDIENIPITFFNGNTINRPSFIMDGTLFTMNYGNVDHVKFQLAFGIGASDNLPQCGVRYKNGTWRQWTKI